LVPQDGENPTLAGQTVRLTVLHTTDIHSRILPYDLEPLKTDRDLGLMPEAAPFGGAARLAALIKRERERSDRTLLLDSGDYFQGAPIFNANTGEPEVRWVSMMGYDGVVMGNHEFDMGAHNFADKVARFGSYPLLAANYHWEITDDPNSHGLDKLSTPYTITNVRGVRVGIIGMASTSSMYGLSDGGNSTQATPLEQNETARSYVELLEPVVDMIVVLSHLGLTEDQELLTGYEDYYPYDSAKTFLERENEPWTQIEPLPAIKPDGTRNTFADGSIRVFIPGVRGIDIIEGGHLHVVLNPPQAIKDPDGRSVLISHSGAFAKYLGRLDLVLEFPPSTKPNDMTDEQWNERLHFGAEVVAHDYKAFPIDSVWCDDEARNWRSQYFVEGTALYNLINQRPNISIDKLMAQGFRDLYPELYRDFYMDDYLEAFPSSIEAEAALGRAYGECQKRIFDDGDLSNAKCNVPLAAPEINAALAAPAGNAALASTFLNIAIRDDSPRDASDRSCVEELYRNILQDKGLTKADWSMNQNELTAFLKKLNAEKETIQTCVGNYLANYRDYTCDRFLPERCWSRVDRCTSQEDRETTHLLSDYLMQLDGTFALPRIFAYAPRDIMRRNSAQGGDAPLGNMTTESMRQRRRVETEFALTNTLGMRDHIYAGPVTLESLFNVFPFENTINIMYLSGAEVQEMTNYVAERSAERGCQAQAQVSGIRFTMDCYQAQLNNQLKSCQVADDCAPQFEGYIPKHQEGWRCTEESVCWANTSFGLTVNNEPLQTSATYKVAVNDYIAKGGSGFKVLKRNTSRIETGISMRDALIDWLRNQCTCEEILDERFPEAERVSANGAPCARAVDYTFDANGLILSASRSIDPMVKTWCNSAKTFESAFKLVHDAGFDEGIQRYEGLPYLDAGKCSCEQVLNGDEAVCGHVTNDLKTFCQAPTQVPIAIGEEDDRIERRVVK
jgi:2',3'-cyclic-nucleotide 2'-phosphodiesterase (5'-nucleotidase family)